jgi:uncharacterized protein (UPF0332 family)
MNKKELLECLKSLSTTNNKRAGVEIKKEEAQLIIEIINKQKEILDKIKEYINDYTVFDGSAMCKNDLDKILEEIE